MLALLRLTLKTANASVPSVVPTLLTASVGVSLSVPPAPVPSSLIVPMPQPSRMIAFAEPVRFMLNASLFSNTASSTIATVIVWLVTPAAKFSVPLTAA